MSNFVDRKYAVRHFGIKMRFLQARRDTSWDSSSRIFSPKSSTAERGILKVPGVIENRLKQKQKVDYQGNTWKSRYSHRQDIVDGDQWAMWLDLIGMRVSPSHSLWRVRTAFRDKLAARRDEILLSRFSGLYSTLMPNTYTRPVFPRSVPLAFLLPSSLVAAGYHSAVGLEDFPCVFNANGLFCARTERSGRQSGSQAVRQSGSQPVAKKRES